MTYKEFVEQAIKNAESEPFCPFGCCYCDLAYTDSCYNCEDSLAEYKRRTE